MSSTPQTLYPQDAWHSTNNARRLRAYMALRNQDIAERIVALRKGRHLSQSAVYDALNVSERGYQNWESGKSKPNYRSLQKLAEFFEVTESYILEGVDNRPEVQGVPEQLDGVSAEFRVLVDAVRGQLEHIETKLDRLLRVVDALLTPRAGADAQETQVALGSILAAAFQANPEALQGLLQGTRVPASPARTAGGRRSRQAG